MVDYKWGYINKAGKYVIPLQYSWAYDFSNDEARVNLENGGHIYINKKGEIIEPKERTLYEDEPSEGMIKINVNNKWGFSDKNGNKVIKAIYDDVKDFKNGTACVKIDGKWGVIDKNGEIVIPAKYYLISPIN